MPPSFINSPTGSPRPRPWGPRGAPIPPGATEHQEALFGLPDPGTMRIIFFSGEMLEIC